MLFLRKAALAAIPLLCLFAAPPAILDADATEVAMRSGDAPLTPVDRLRVRSKLDLSKPSDFASEILAASHGRVDAGRFMRPADRLKARLKQRAGGGDTEPADQALPNRVMLAAAKGLPLARRWGGARAALEAAKHTLDDCEAGECASPRLAILARQIGTLRNQPLGNRIAGVKRYMNRYIRYQSDRRGQDVWTDPLKTAVTRAGDCEDHAILAWALLEHAGIDKADLALVVLRNRANGIGHAVVAVRTGDGRKVVLDNNLKRPVAETQAKYSLMAVADTRGFFVPIKPGQPKHAPALATLALR